MKFSDIKSPELREALRQANGGKSDDNDIPGGKGAIGSNTISEVERLAALSDLAYEQQREPAAARLGIRVTALDKMGKKGGAQGTQDAAGLPHWNVEPWEAEVPGAELLDDIVTIFCKYIVLPEGADVALALWVLHAWTFDAGDISPFLVLVSPTKRCGKTSTLIILFYLT